MQSIPEIKQIKKLKNRAVCDTMIIQKYILQEALQWQNKRQMLLTEWKKMTVS